MKSVPWFSLPLKHDSTPQLLLIARNAALFHRPLSSLTLGSMEAKEVSFKKEKTG